MPQVSRITTDGDDILAWWKKHSGMFPNLSKMARQFLALPASSVGVERLFSAAGRMHDSFRKSTKEVTLQAQLCVPKQLILNYFGISTIVYLGVVCITGDTVFTLWILGYGEV